uniref:Lid2 complex component lid2 n=1 Tax=Ganoderma boninense TaxID=34458 RepID=A0A5K1K4N2_9APHY|nr:Lid2 complex component lid2 [Ganoderma boninense]
MIDRAVNTIVKDVILKGFVIVYEDVSPTRNRKAAMKKMTIAGEFIAKNGLTMPEQSLGELEALYNELVQLQPSVTTGWRDLISHPVKTYTNARDFRKGAGKLLDDAITASSKGNFQRVRNARKRAEDAVQQIHRASSEGASNDNVNVPAAQGNAVAAATATLSTPPPAHLDTGVGGDSSPIAYLRFRDSDVTFGPNTRAKLEFNGETFTMVLFPNHSQTSGGSRSAC